MAIIYLNDSGAFAFEVHVPFDVERSTVATSSLTSTAFCFPFPTIFPAMIYRM